MLAEQYRAQGCNLLPTFFTNPLAPGDTAKGNQNIEPGIMEMMHRMETGRLKIFPHLMEWFKEFRAYHRKDGKIEPIRDDLMSATRYGVMSIHRFGMVGRGHNSGYSFDTTASLPIRNTGF